jgi:DNA-binding NarL/FixJ family response regulator
VSTPDLRARPPLRGNTGGTASEAVARERGPGRRPRLIIADDHRLVAAGFRSLLESSYEIAGIAITGDELLAVLAQCPADCLLLDLVMPGHNGLSLIPTVRRLQPELKVVIVTMLVDRVVADAAVGAGASGFVPKDSSREELEVALSTVLAGGLYMSPRVPKTTHRVGLDARHPGLERLTPRQEQILLFLGEGRSQTEIARQLGVSKCTVTLHKRNLMRALGFTTSGALIQFAFQVRLDVQQ